MDNPPHYKENDNIKCLDKSVVNLIEVNRNHKDAINDLVRAVNQLQKRVQQDDDKIKELKEGSLVKLEELNN